MTSFYTQNLERRLAEQGKNQRRFGACANVFYREGLSQGEINARNQVGEQFFHITQNKGIRPAINQVSGLYQTQTSPFIPANASRILQEEQLIMNLPQRAQYSRVNNTFPQRGLQRVNLNQSIRNLTRENIQPPQPRLANDERLNIDSNIAYLRSPVISEQNRYNFNQRIQDIDKRYRNLRNNLFDI